MSYTENTNRENKVIYTLPAAFLFHRLLFLVPFHRVVDVLFGPELLIIDAGIEN